MLDDPPISVHLFEENDRFTLAGAVDVGEEDVVEQFLHEHRELMGAVGRGVPEVGRSLDGLSGDLVAHQTRPDVFLPQLNYDVFPS